LNKVSISNYVIDKPLRTQQIRTISTMDDVIASQPSFTSLDGETDYYQLMDDYADRYFDVVGDYQVLYTRLQECIAFIDGVKVQYCHEYLKCSYRRTFEFLSDDIKDLGASISRFPESSRFHCANIVDAENYNSKKMSITTLDDMLNYFNGSVDFFKEQVEANAKIGLELYNESQKIEANTCR
jgi:hypothetical protein